MFWGLTRARHYDSGMPAGVAVQEMSTWFDIQGIWDRETRKEMYDLFIIMDVHFLQHYSEKIAKAAKRT